MHDPSNGGPERLVRQPKRSLSALSGPYGHPIHPILVTVPIGAWVASFVFDLVSRGSENPSGFATGSYWLIGLGIVGAAVAAVFGLMDLFTVPRGTRAWRTGIAHMTLNLVVTSAFTLSWIVRLFGDYDRVPGWLIGYSFVTLAFLGMSGWLGGRLVYRYGVRVVDERRQADGFKPPRFLRRSA